MGCSGRTSKIKSSKDISQKEKKHDTPGSAHLSLRQELAFFFKMFFSSLAAKGKKPLATEVLFVGHCVRCHGSRDAVLNDLAYVLPKELGHVVQGLVVKQASHVFLGFA